MKALRVYKQVHTIELWLKGHTTQREGARALGVSVRHFWRLVRRIEAEGVSGLSRRLSPAKRAIKAELKAKAVSLIQEHFYDYGPTLASEKLAQHFDLSLSKETVRQWMIYPKRLEFGSYAISKSAFMNLATSSEC